MRVNGTTYVHYSCLIMHGSKTVILHIQMAYVNILLTVMLVVVRLPSQIINTDRSMSIYVTPSAFEGS